MTVIFNSLPSNSVILGGGSNSLSSVLPGSLGNILLSNGSTWISSSMSAGYLTGTIPSVVLGNSTHYIGTTSIALNRASGVQTLTGVSIDGNAATSSNSSLLNGQDSTYYTNPTNFSSAVPASKGGTGSTSLAANNVILGNGTSTVQNVAPGTSGNVLTSTGSTWVSSPSFAAPTGVIYMYAGASAPSGWIICDGSAVSRTTYAALFATIGTVFGSGDNSTTFNIPDFRDRVPVGSSSTRNLGTKGGSSTQTPSGSISVDNTSITIAQLPSHSHGVNDSGHSHSIYDPGHNHSTYINNGTEAADTQLGAYQRSGDIQGSSPWGSTFSVTGIGVYGSITGITIQSTGSGSGHNHTASFSGSTMSVEQQYTTINYIIKT